MARRTVRTRWPQVAGILAAFLAALLPLLSSAASAQEPGRAEPQERRDTVMGAGGDSVRTGRDPETGDTVLGVSPQEQPRDQYPMPMPGIVIQPEVRLPAGGQQQQQPAGQ